MSWLGIMRTFTLHPQALATLTALTALTALALACGGKQDDSASSFKPASSSSSGGGSSPTPTSPGAPTCDATFARDIAVSSDDANGYPPYAIAECSLVYVSSDGALVLRDLSSNAEITLAPTSERPRRPAVGVDIDETGTRKLVIAWETTLAPGPAVRVRYGDRVSTMQGNFIMAGEPRARDRFVAFTVWNGPKETDDTDVWLYDARTGRQPRMAIGGAGQQRFPDVSRTHVVAADFAEDPDGHFDRENDLADITVFEIATAHTTRRLAPNKQSFPMLGDDGVTLAYLEWAAVHPQPKLWAYDLRAGSIDKDYASDRLIAHVEYESADPARPALAGDTLEWIANPEGETMLYRAPADGSSPAARVAGLDKLRLFAPAPRRDFTVIAAVDPAASQQRAPLLRTIAR